MTVWRLGMNMAYSLAATSQQVRGMARERRGWMALEHHCCSWLSRWRMRYFEDR